MALDFETLRHYLRINPALRLLRSDHAAFVISFFYDQFKNPLRSDISHGEVVERLDDYLRLRNEIEPESYPRTAEEYLSSWCNPEYGYLRRFYKRDTDEPSYELTPETEELIFWLEELEKDEFVGTESRFMHIIQLLQEMVEQATEEPEKRLAQLQARKNQIEAEMETIRETGQVDTYTGTQLRERFLETDREVRRLMADFKTIEQRFREITREVREQQIAEGLARGTVVRHVIDADETLMASEQGQSFYAFWDFLLSSGRQETLDRLLDALYQLGELEEVTHQNPQLRKLKIDLISAAKRVVQSNHHLAQQLRRMFDEAYLLEHRRVLELAGQIKRLAVDVKEYPPEKKFFVLETSPHVQLPMERPLWEPVYEPVFDIEPVVATGDISNVKARELFDPFFVDTAALERRIERLLQSRKEISLGEVLEEHPAQKGLAEIVYYLEIASAGRKHVISSDHWEEVVVYPASGDEFIALSIPQVIYVR